MTAQRPDYRVFAATTVLAAAVLCVTATLDGAALQAAPGMVMIPAGSYRPLYNGTTPRRVEAFEMDAVPVTNGEYLAFVRANPQWQRSRAGRLFVDAAYLRHWTSDLEPGAGAPLTAPVTAVSWFAARAYLEAQRKRLPTVDQWEYVASLRDARGVAGLHGRMREWTLDFNSSIATGDSRRDASLDRALFCGAAAFGLSGAGDGEALLRLAFRTSLEARYSVPNLGFRGVRAVAEDLP